MVRTKRLVLGKKVRRALVTWGLISAAVAIPDLVRPVPTTQAAAPVATLGDYCGPDAFFGTVIREGGNSTGNFTCHRVVATGPTGNQTWNNPGIPSYTIHVMGGGGGAAGTNTSGYCGNPGHNSTLFSYSATSTSFSYTIGGGGGGGTGSSSGNAGGSITLNLAGSSYTSAGGAGGVSEQPCGGYTYPSERTQWSNYGAGGVGTSDSTPYNGDGSAGGGGALIVTYTPPIPAAPMTVSASNTPGSVGSVDVAWQPPADDTFVTDYVATATSSDGGTTRTCSATMSSFSVPTTCTLTGASTGKTYTVTVKAYTALSGASPASSASSFVVPDPPTNSTVPTISGSGGKYAVGTSISATDGTWTGDNDPAITFAYQWQRCTDPADASTCADISGATSNEYTPVAGDGNKFLRIKVTATNEYGSTVAYSVLSTNQEVATVPVFTSASPSNLAERYFAYSYTFQASGGRVSYSVTWDSGPVTGLTIDPSTGVFSGTPTEAGSDYSYSVTATNDAGSVVAGPFTLSLADGNETALEIVTQPVGGASGDTLTQQPVVRVVDEDGRVIIRPLTVTVSASPGTLGGTMSVSTSAGVATFNDLTLAGPVNTDHLLTFTLGGLTNSAVVQLTPGAVHSLRIDTQPVAATASGDALITQPVLTVLDAQGNLVDDRPVSISVTSVLASNTSTTAGSVGGSQATGFTTNTGVALFTNLTFGGSIGTNYKLKFESGAISVLSNDVSNTAAGAASRLIVRTQPVLDGTQLVGSAFATQPAVDIVDAGGNPTTSTAVVTATPSAGLLDGTTSVAGVSGTTTFTDLTFAGLIGTAYTLTFTSPGLTSTTSASFSFANSSQVGAVSEAVSTVTASASSLVADGTTTATITVAMKDLGGNNITSSQGAVSLSATSGTLGAVTDHNNGTYSATFTAPAARGSGTSVISAALGGTAMSGTATITLVTAQTISFVQSSVSLGIAPFSLTASASSGLPVSFSLGGATTNGACTVSSSGVVTVLAVGDCQVLADQSGDGTHAAAPQVSQTFAVQPSTPTAPFITSVTPGNTTTSVAFAVPGFDGGATITDYEYSIDGGATWLSAGSATSPLTISGLTNGTAYTIIIRAMNTAGAGLPSAPSSSFTPSVAGGAPVTTSATTPSAPRELVVLTGSGTSVTLHWKVPVSDGGSPLTGYVVNSTPAATCTVATNSIAGTALCSASGLTAGQTYTFTVSAVNAVGAGTAATVAYTVPGGNGGGNNPNNGGGGGGGGTNTDDDNDGDNGTEPGIGGWPGGPGAPPLPGTDDDGLPDPWRPVVDPNNVPGRPCSGCVQLFPAPGDEGSPGTGGSGGSGGNGGSDGGTSRPGVTSTPPGSKPGTITVTTGGGTTIVIGGNDPGGKPATSTSPNGGLVVESPGNVPIVLSGLKPGSTVTVWLADNLSVTGVVGPDGTVSLMAPIPNGLDSGTYTGRVDMIDADGVARSLLFGFEWRGSQNTLPVTGSGSLDLLVIVMWLFVAGILVRASSRRRYLRTDCHGSIL